MPISDPVRWPGTPDTLLTTPLTGSKRKSQQRWEQHRAAYTAAYPGPAGMNRQYRSGRLTPQQSQQRHAEMKSPPQERLVERVFDARLTIAGGQQKRRQAEGRREADRQSVLSRSQFAETESLINEYHTATRRAEAARATLRDIKGQVADRSDPYRIIGGLERPQN